MTDTGKTTGSNGASKAYEELRRKVAETLKAKAKTEEKKEYTPPPPREGLCLTPAEWMARDIPPPDRLLGDVFTTTTRTQLAADTGLGKTMFGMAISFAMRLKHDFLAWKAHREASVLYIDGEMPLDLIKERIEIGASWFGADPSTIDGGFHFLSREDVEQMPPLDTEDGARWLLGFIASLGKVDHVTLDNYAALCIMSLKEEDGEATLKQLRSALTSRRIGQLWIHHTGHDTSRGYGRKLLEWRLDTSIVGERLDVPDTDVAMTLKFPKARRRKPETREQFEPINVMLSHGLWTFGKDGADPARDRCLAVVKAILAGCDRRPKLMERLKLSEKVVNSIIADCRKRKWVAPDDPNARGKARSYVVTELGRSEYAMDF